MSWPLATGSAFLVIAQGFVSTTTQYPGFKMSYVSLFTFPDRRAMSVNKEVPVEGRDKDWLVCATLWLFPAGLWSLGNQNNLKQGRIDPTLHLSGLRKRIRELELIVSSPCFPFFWVVKSGSVGEGSHLLLHWTQPGSSCPVLPATRSWLGCLGLKCSGCGSGKSLSIHNQIHIFFLNAIVLQSML